jgi:hypothetical protein
VVLLAGNRDINKLRLPRELGAHPPTGAPDPLPLRLQHILTRTMGAPDAFAHRAAELGGADDDAVVASFLAEVAPPDGSLFAYLSAARLGWRWRDVLFLHGGVTEENLGVVPGRERLPTVDSWLAALNAFLVAELAAYRAAPTEARHHALIQYQAPLPGTRANNRSVVYTRPVNRRGEPIALPARLRAHLQAEGIRRLVVGHTPTGDCPSMVVDEGFTVFMGDTSYSPLERGARIELHADHSEIFGAALVDGRVELIRARLPLEPPAPIGRVVDGWLIKARLDEGWLGFRMDEGFVPVQTRRSGGGGPALDLPADGEDPPA